MTQKTFRDFTEDVSPKRFNCVLWASERSCCFHSTLLTTPSNGWSRVGNQSMRSGWLFLVRIMSLH